MSGRIQRNESMLADSLRRTASDELRAKRARETAALAELAAIRKHKRERIAKWTVYVGLAVFFAVFFYLQSKGN